MSSVTKSVWLLRSFTVLMLVELITETLMVGRQRQYFEQKKRRQQQREGLQNQDDIDGAGNQAYGDQAPRSLDVLSLNNLATPVCHRNGPESEPLYMFYSDSSNELARHGFYVVNHVALLAQSLENLIKQAD